MWDQLACTGIWDIVHEARTFHDHTMSSAEMIACSSSPWSKCTAMGTFNKTYEVELVSKNPSTHAQPVMSFLHLPLQTLLQQYSMLIVALYHVSMHLDVSTLESFVRQQITIRIAYGCNYWEYKDIFLLVRWLDSFQLLLQLQLLLLLQGYRH